MKYLFILNPKSGPTSRADKMVSLIDSLFSASGHEYEFSFTTGPGDATQIAKKGAEDGFDLMVAVGGDGTVNEVATGLIDTNAILGIIPLGSGNGVARSLNIPLKVKSSIQLLLDPQIQTIDTGLINDLPFIGVAGLGYDANVGAKFQEFGVRGPIPYFFIGLKEYLRFKPLEVSLEIEDQWQDFSALVIAFANTREYGNGAVIAPQAIPDDGYLDICIVSPFSKKRAIKLTQRLFNGTIDKAKEYTHIKCKRLALNVNTAEVYIHTDGEPKKITGNLEIRIKEKSLRVCRGK